MFPSDDIEAARRLGLGIPVQPPAPSRPLEPDVLGISLLSGDTEPSGELRLQVPLHDTRGSESSSERTSKKSSSFRASSLLPDQTPFPRKSTGADGRSVRIASIDYKKGKRSPGMYRSRDSTSIDPKRFSRKFSASHNLKKACAAPDRHEEVAVRMIVKTSLLLGMGAFLVSILVTVLLNVLFSSIRYATTSDYDISQPGFKPKSSVNNYLFLTITFALVSCVLSIIGTLFLNLVIHWVNSKVQRSSLRNNVVSTRQSQLL